MWMVHMFVKIVVRFMGMKLQLNLLIITIVVGGLYVNSLP